MRFLPLVWSGIWRKPGRTVLIFLQATVTFALFGVLQGLKGGVDNAVAEARADLLLVHGRTGLFSLSLPVSLLTQIQALPGVKFADPVELFGGIYQNPSQKIGIVAVRPNPGWLSTFTFQVAPQYAEALRKTRTGALIRVRLAKKYGWTIGDRIPLQTNLAQKNGSTNWTFDVVGTYTDSDVGGGLDTILVNYDYVDEARATDAGTVQHINVAVTDPKIADTVADEIDRRFANSPNETETSSLRDLAEQQMQSIGDLNFLIHAIVGTVFVALLFATATMLMQSTRERTPELAVLKALGFNDGTVFVLILAEAIVIFCTAALGGLAFAALAACASAALPALHAARLRVATALAAH